MQLDASTMAAAVDLSTLNRQPPAAAPCPSGHSGLRGPGQEPEEAFTLGLGVCPDGTIAVVLGCGPDQWFLPPDVADQLAEALRDAAEQARNPPPPANAAAAAVPQAV